METQVLTMDRVRKMAAGELPPDSSMERIWHYVEQATFTPCEKLKAPEDFADELHIPPEQTEDFLDFTLEQIRLRGEQIADGDEPAFQVLLLDDEDEDSDEGDEDDVRAHFGRIHHALAADVG